MSSISAQVIPKTVKTVRIASLIGTRYSRLDSGGLDHQMICKCRTSVSESNAEDKFNFLQYCDNQRDSNLNLPHQLKMSKAELKQNQYLRNSIIFKPTGCHLTTEVLKMTCDLRNIHQKHQQRAAQKAGFCVLLAPCRPQLTLSFLLLLLLQQ